jgi:hypothetical protein
MIEKPGLRLNVILANTTKPQQIFVPYVTEYMGANFTDSASLYVVFWLKSDANLHPLVSWAANCAATPATNGQDRFPDGIRERDVVSKRRAMANHIDNHNTSAVGLPIQYQPGLPTVGGSAGVILSYILPGNTTGVVSQPRISSEDAAEALLRCSLGRFNRMTMMASRPMSILRSKP